MKTCRFCNFQQERGDFCEACGSPFSADKVDFSEGLPEMMGGPDAFPDPTASAFPDPTKPVAGTSSVPETPPEVSTPAPAAAVTAAAVPSADTPAEVPAPKPVPEKKTPAPEERKVWYSAREAGETVYTKNRGSLKSGNYIPESFNPSLSSSDDAPKEPSGPGWWNGAPNASSGSSLPDPSTIIAAASAPQQDPKAAFAPYNGVYTHTLITFVLSAVGLLCLCGMSFISLILSGIAFASMLNVKSGTSIGNNDKTVNRAKILTIIADVLLVFALITMIIALAVS